MQHVNLKTPVALFIFNRPDTTVKVFARIREVRPRTLLVVADGPRVSSEGEAERCTQARKVVERVDWDCRVLRHYSDENLGCKIRVSSGIDWIFRNVEEAIILEDDCLPDRTFFRYCEELLDRYRSDTRIMAISGDNFQFGRRPDAYSYYFSRYPHIWGWATWRRAWHHYDVNMRFWPEIRDRGLLTELLGRNQSAYWAPLFDAVYRGEIDTWDYQWTFACWLHGGLTALPATNLVSNIGFGAGATHTRAEESHFANMHVEALSFPLRHPPYVLRDAAADRFTESKSFHTSRVREFVTGLWRELRKATGGK